MPCLHGCCGGALDSIDSIFTQLHRSGFNLESETWYKFICQVIADLWKANEVVASKTAFVLFSNNVKKIRFPKKGLYGRIKTFAKSFKVLAVLSIHKS